VLVEADAEPADVLAELRALRAEHAAVWAELRHLRKELRTLQAQRGPRDEDDAAIPACIARAIGSRPFTAAWLIRNARVNPDRQLRQALAAATVENARQLGKLLRRLEGVEIDSREVRRVPSARRQAVRQWFVFVRVENTCQFRETLRP
jgi:hypothetical protein